MADGASGPATVSVQREDFDISAEIRRVAAGNRDIGAVVSFTGLVRGGSGDAVIQSMELEHWPGVTEAALARIVEEADGRWPLDRVRVIHRFGPLAPGEQIVLVLTASRHRRAAFEAAEFIMDYLKTRAPFWKKEHGPAGPTWVDARETDDMDAGRWRRGS